MRKTRAATRGLAAAFLADALVVVPDSAAADDEPPPTTGYNGLVGMGSALGTLIYAPLKLTYAVTGSVIGGLAWVVTGGNNSVATSIMRNSLKGDYVISPSHVEGERRLRFRGADR